MRTTIEMQLKPTVRQFFFVVIVFFGFYWTAYDSDFPYPTHKNEYYYENITRYETSLITQNIRFENYVTWPRVFSLQLDSWASDTRFSNYLSNAHNASSERRNLLMEWIAAFSVGAFSIAIGLILVLASGARLSWT